MTRIRRYENLHILLWLLKDLCWMFEWKIPGMVMIVPTLTVAILITVTMVSEKSDESWVNLAICFWIAANSYWMICEFAEHDELKNYAGIPFVMGIFAVTWFYIKRYRENRRILDQD